MKIEGENVHSDTEVQAEVMESQHFQEQHILEATEQVSDLFVETAEKYLDDDPELKDAVIDFYSDQVRLSAELGNVFKGKTPEEIQERIQNIETICDSKEDFCKYVERYIESFQSTTERSNSFKRRDTRIQENPIATEVEYELGAFRESMEAQVADAVFEFADKGYHPFESGLDEDPNSREQFIGFYDSEIVLPEELVDKLKTNGFEIYVEEMDDRSQIRITPPDDRNVRSSEWKTIWDQVAEHFPKNENKNVKSEQTYGYHKEFRDFQDTLRKSWVG